MDDAARVLGECRTREEAVKRLVISAKEWRKELVAEGDNSGTFVLQGYQQRDQVAWRTFQRVQLERAGDVWRILIWPETDAPI